MNAMTSFFVGLASTMGVVAIVLAPLNKPLRVALADRFGTGGLASFWRIFVNAILIFVPFALALGQRAAAGGWQETVLQICSQLESALIGFSISLVVVGWVLARYVLGGASARLAK